MKYKIMAGAFALALMSAGVAPAHEPAPGVHGGQTVHAGKYVLEITPDATGFTVYVADDATERPLSVAALSARATVLSGGQTQTVDLAKSGANAFRGAVPLNGAWRVIVSVSGGAAAPAQARFAAASGARPK